MTCEVKTAVSSRLEIGTAVCFVVFALISNRGAARSGRRCALAVRYAEILRSAHDDGLGAEVIGESERRNLKGGFGGFGGFCVKRNGGRGHHTVGLLRDGG